MDCSEEQRSISKGSKSFYFASLFFSPEVRGASWRLYRWCRYCDDVIDSASDPVEAERRLEFLLEKTKRALAEDHVTEFLEPEFLGLRSLCREYRIPSQYPLDLIRGFEMDVRGINYESIKDVESYAYHVAGVVGLMMTYIFGVKDVRAYRHAIDLGVAMQLTNIARDVEEDYSLQRVYLPSHWLSEAQIPKEKLTHPELGPSVHAVKVRLLQRASLLYKSGYRGLQYLPLRAALAVSIAGSIYSFIGFKIVRRPTDSARVYVTALEKLLLAVTGSIRVVPVVLVRAATLWRSREAS